MKSYPNFRSILVLNLLLIAFSCTGVFAADTGKFVFYYQRIEKVEKILPTEKPNGVWETAKHWVQKGLNTARRLFEKTVTRNLFPGEGSKLWFSEKDPTIAYRMKREKVTSEKHLLAMMGAANGDTSKLTDGQKSLLYMYRNSQNQQLRELSQKAIFPNIKVHLTDTTGFENGKDFPNVTDDFWPMSMGFSITMNSKRYSSPGDEIDAMSTLVHETAHCTNLTFSEIIKPYGPDGKHFTNEILQPRSAFQEAWSQYQEVLFSPSTNLSSLESSAKRFKREDPKIAGEYKYLSITDPSVTPKDIMSVESVNAVIMYRIASGVPDGVNKVNNAFYKGNVPWRSMEGYIKGFCKLYPADSQKVSEILDQMTAGKMSEGEIRKLCGNVTVTRVARISSNETLPAKGEGSPALAASSQAATQEGQALQGEYEKTYLELVKAAQAGKEDLMKKLQTKIQSLRTRIKKLTN